MCWYDIVYIPICTSIVFDGDINREIVKETKRERDVKERERCRKRESERNREREIL